MPADGQNNKLEVTGSQLEALQDVLELGKALATAGRLALLGVLALHPDQAISGADLAERVGLAWPRIERDLRQLIQAGLVEVVEWHPAPAGREPLPALLKLSGDYLKRIPAIISRLHQLQAQTQPGQAVEALDERAKTLKQFMSDGRLHSFPAQYKRQLYILEEVAKVFEPGIRYSEHQVDAILKDIYEYDHCSLRRALVDARLLTRAQGIYWKEPRAVTPD